MFNGFGYGVNRWIWGYCFVISFIVVEMFPDILKLPEKVKWIVRGVRSFQQFPLSTSEQEAKGVK